MSKNGPKLGRKTVPKLRKIRKKGVPKTASKLMPKKGAARTQKNETGSTSGRPWVRFLGRPGGFGGTGNIPDFNTGNVP